MSGWHHVACHPVATVPDLSCTKALACLLITHLNQLAPNSLTNSPTLLAHFTMGLITHLWHSRLAFEPPSHSVVDALRLPPARVDAFKAIRLMAVESFRMLLDDRDVLFCRNHLWK